VPTGIYWGLYEQIKAYMHAHVMAGRAHGSVSSQAWDQFVVRHKPVFPLWPHPELPLPGYYVSVTIQILTEVQHAGKSGRHFHLVFNIRCTAECRPLCFRVRYAGSGYYYTFFYDLTFIIEKLDMRKKLQFKPQPVPRA
jgi:hypothetical protein